jgi:hypothetical protein
MDDELGAEKSRWDDAITVTARDDEIIFTYPIDSTAIAADAGRETELARQLEEVTRREHDTARAIRALRDEVKNALATEAHTPGLMGGLPFCSCGTTLTSGTAPGDFITHILAVTRKALPEPAERPCWVNGCTKHEGHSGPCRVALAGAEEKG